MKTKTSLTRNSISRSPLRNGFFLIAFVLACFALAPQARAVCQEGCDLTNGDTFLGDDALVNNTTGANNTAIGESALVNNTTGGGNTAVGWEALVSNTTGTLNTANGWEALFRNTTGNYNTAAGNDALFSNTIGNDNTATGGGALLGNTTGNSNTAIGREALVSNTTGTANIAVGFLAGGNLTRGSNNIDIGNAGFANESNKIRIGTNGTHRNTFIAGISGVTVADGVGVIIDARGHLGTVVSSNRFKEKVKPMDKVSEAILALKPVTFCYKHELDPDGTLQFGLVAEEVEKINPDLVARDGEGKPYTVRYEAVNAMLLNEFLKEHRKVEAQESKIEQQEAKIARQQKQIEALTTGLQKVSAQLGASKPAQQVVKNP